MNTMVKEGLFSRVMFLNEMHGDVVISLADNCGPFGPILLSESEGEMDSEDEHKSGHEVESDVSPHTGDGKGVWVDMPNRRPPCMGVFSEVMLLDEKYGDDVISLAGDFGPFEPFTELESGGEMDGQDKQRIGYEVQQEQQQQLVPQSEHRKGARIVDTPDCGRPSMDVVVSGKATRICHEVQCKFAPQSEYGKGAGVAYVPHCKPPCMGVVKSGKVARIGSHSKFKPNQEHHQAHALPMRLRLADHRVPYSELL
jgi:hypothetical protein